MGTVTSSKSVPEVSLTGRTRRCASASGVLTFVLGSALFLQARHAAADAGVPESPSETEGEEPSEEHGETEDSTSEEAETKEEQSPPEQDSEESSADETSVLEQGSAVPSGPPDEVPEPPDDAPSLRPGMDNLLHLSDEQRESAKRAIEFARDRADRFGGTKSIYERLRNDVEGRTEPGAGTSSDAMGSEPESVEEPGVGKEANTAAEPGDVVEGTARGADDGADIELASTSSVLIRRRSKDRTEDDSWNWLWGLAGVATLLLIPIGLLLARPTRNS